MKIENIAIIFSIILSISALIFSMISWYSDHNLQKEMFELQRQIAEKEEVKENKPPTISLTQEFSAGSSGNLEITPTLYFKKNSERLFTISNYEINVTLNGKREPLTGAGYEAKFRDEEIPTGMVVFHSFYPETNYSEFNRGINDLVIDYVLEIIDMDSRIRYRGNVTTEINSSSNLLKFPSGNEPIVFNLTKI